MPQAPRVTLRENLVGFLRNHPNLFPTTHPLDLGSLILKRAEVISPTNVYTESDITMIFQEIPEGVEMYMKEMLRIEHQRIINEYALRIAKK